MKAGKLGPDEIGRIIEVGQRVQREIEWCEDIPEGFRIKREGYDATCPYCGRKFTFRASLFMEVFRRNLGGGQCIECGNQMQLRIRLSDNTGVAIKYEVPGA